MEVNLTNSWFLPVKEKEEKGVELTSFFSLSFGVGVELKDGGWENPKETIGGGGAVEGSCLGVAPGLGVAQHGHSSQSFPLSA